METLRKTTEILFDTSIYTAIDTSTQPSSSRNFTAQSIKNLCWERVKQLTSPTTSYDAIKYFTEHSGTGIHPCVVVEIVLKWWSVRTDGEHVDMSFIKPLITTIQNVSSSWYYTVCRDERYKGLIKTLDIPEPTTTRFVYYIINSEYNKRILKDCISKGDGTPAQLEGFGCSNNMERYRQSVPVFRYNAAVFPPFGDTKHHWYINIRAPVHSGNYMSLITNSQKEILDYIVNKYSVVLCFVLLPDTLQ